MRLTQVLLLILVILIVYYYVWPKYGSLVAGWLHNVGLESYRSCPGMYYHGYPVDCPDVPDFLVMNPFIWPYSGGMSPAEVLTTAYPQSIMVQEGGPSSGTSSVVEGSPEEVAVQAAGENAQPIGGVVKLPPQGSSSTANLMPISLPQGPNTSSL